MTGPLAWHASTHAGRDTLVLEGDITEDADLDGLRAALRTATELDTSAVRRINSCGVRDWMAFLSAAEAEGKDITLHRCAVPLVSQLNMIANFRGHCTITSVMAPFVCGACDHELTEEIALDGTERERIQNPPPCPACGAAAMEFDDLEEQFFAFLDDERA